MIVLPPTSSLTKEELAARRAQARLATQSAVKASTDQPIDKTKHSSEQSPPRVDSTLDGPSQPKNLVTAQLDAIQSTLRRRIGFIGLGRDKINPRPEISSPISDHSFDNKPLPARPPESPGERASHPRSELAPAAPRRHAPSRPSRPARGLSIESVPASASQRRSFNSLQRWRGFQQPVKRHIHLRDGSVVTVSSPPELDLWTQRVYLPGPIRLQKLDLVSRKGSLASLEPFQTMLDDAYQIVTSRRASEDATANEICSYFEALGTCDIYTASEGLQWDDLSDSDETEVNIDTDRFMTPPDSPLMEARRVSVRALMPIETEETLRTRGIASVRRSRELEEQRKAALADNGIDKAVEAGLNSFDARAPASEVTSSTSAAAGTETSMPHAAVHRRRDLLSPIPGSQESSAPWIQSSRDRAASKLKRYSH